MVLRISSAQKVMEEDGDFCQGVCDTACYRVKDRRAAPDTTITQCPSLNVSRQQGQRIPLIVIPFNQVILLGEYLGIVVFSAQITIDVIFEPEL